MRSNHADQVFFIFQPENILSSNFNFLLVKLQALSAFTRTTSCGIVVRSCVRIPPTNSFLFSNPKIFYDLI